MAVRLEAHVFDVPACASGCCVKSLCVHVCVRVCVCVCVCACVCACILLEQSVYRARAKELVQVVAA